MTNPGENLGQKTRERPGIPGRSLSLPDDLCRNVSAVGRCYSSVRFSAALEACCLRAASFRLFAASAQAAAAADRASARAVGAVSAVFAGLAVAHDHPPASAEASAVAALAAARS